MTDRAWLAAMGWRIDDAGWLYSPWAIVGDYRYADTPAGHALARAEHEAHECLELERLSAAARGSGYVEPLVPDCLPAGFAG